jgi:hypothetical protein
MPRFDPQAAIHPQFSLSSCEPVPFILSCGAGGNHAVERKLAARPALVQQSHQSCIICVKCY